MNIDARSVETDREGTAARLVDTIPSVLLSASDINVPHLSSEDYSAGSEKCEGLCCNDDTVPYQPTEASVLGKIKTIYGDGKSKRERSFQEYWRHQFNDSRQSREEAVQANHKNSRKRRSQKKLYQQRQSVLKEKEQKKWSEIDPSFMTDESDYEQLGKKVKVTHKPAWRSNLLERMIAKLDKRLAAKETAKSAYAIGFKRRERIARLLSVSQAPSTAPAWAVTDDVSNPGRSLHQAWNCIRTCTSQPCLWNQAYSKKIIELHI
ncbi:hypothetical protein EMCRGX_G022611 [Ephydatia muelleri]